MSGRRWSQDGLRGTGARVGSGVVRTLGADRCPWEEVRGVVRYAAGESAGQCGPCMFGLPAVADDLDRLLAGGGPAVEQRLRGRLGLLPGRGACRHPDGVAGYLGSAMLAFEAELAAHRNGWCRAGLQGSVTDEEARPRPAGDRVAG